MLPSSPPSSFLADIDCYDGRVIRAISSCNESPHAATQDAEATTTFSIVIQRTWSNVIVIFFKPAGELPITFYPGAPQNCLDIGEELSKRYLMRSSSDGRPAPYWGRYCYHQIKRGQLMKPLVKLMVPSLLL